jgi:hypothetical protein
VTTGNLITAFTVKVLDYYFPGANKIEVPKPPSDFLERAQAYEGYYRQTCYSMRTLEKIELLMGLAPEIEVKANPNRTLLIGRKNYVEVEPMYFEQLNGRAFASFRKNREGIMSNVFLEQDAFERIHWYETNRFQVLYAGASLAVFGIALLVWPVKAILPKVRLTLLDHLSAGISAAHLTLLITLYFTIAKRSLFQMTYGVPLALKLALCLPILAIVLTGIFLILLIRKWKSKSIFGRVIFSIYGVAAVAFILSLHYWNLIGFHY